MSNVLVMPLLAAVIALLGLAAGEEITLLNVSYDPTRELWRDINDHFIPLYAKETGDTLSIKQSHGGSSTQARAVIDGLEADVVTLASIIDTNAISKSGLIEEAWMRCEAPGQERKGIDILAVAPGWVESSMTAELKPEIRRAAEQRSPEGRFATSEECAAFLCRALLDPEAFPPGHVYSFWAPHFDKRAPAESGPLQAALPLD
ncbi:MAG: SDR family oxidoreductase [Candidatus Binatia bacterium]